MSDCVEMGGVVAWTPRANKVVWGPVLGVSSMSPPTGDKSVESRCWGSGLMSGLLAAPSGSFYRGIQEGKLH